MKKKIEFDNRTPSHFRNFMNTMMDIELLLDSHTRHLQNNSRDINGFNDVDTIYIRSAYILLCSAWEAFVEDIATAGVVFLVENAEDNKMPKTLLKSIAASIKEDKNELSPWLLSADKWKNYVKSYAEKKIILLNSPKSKNIDGIFKEFFDINITDYWTWDCKIDSNEIVTFSKENTIGWIDGFVADRGAIAHGRVTDLNRNAIIFLNIYHRINQVQIIIHNVLIDKLKGITGVDVWEKGKYSLDWKPFLKIEYS